MVSNLSDYFNNQLTQRKKRRRMAQAEEVQDVPDPPDAPPGGGEGDGQPLGHEQGQSNALLEGGSRRKEMSRVQVVEWMAKANRKQAELEKLRKEKQKQRDAKTKNKTG